MALRFYNTLSRQKEEFVPLIPGRVGVYSCGPTVYHYAHIGNIRTSVFNDLLRRTLEYNNFQVTQVINITDVGEPAGNDDSGQDKLERAAETEGKTVSELADFYYHAWRTDLDQINIKTSDTIFPWATKHIAEQISLIEKLEKGGHTYQTTDAIYFDTTTYPAYADLAHLDLAGMKEGARVEANPAKRNPADFALWKFSRPAEKRQQEWPSPWGIGYPGWHIECSAMSMKYLGAHFDIHTGGIDLLPTHHTNERAQSEAATGKPFVNYWLHSGFLNVEGEKMSKSLGNIYRLTDLVEQDITPLAYRYWLLTAHYRKTINLTWDALEGAETAYKKLEQVVLGLQETVSNKNPTPDQNYTDRFLSIINDDLDMPSALALLWELVKDETVPPSNKLATLLDFDRVLGLGLDQVTAPEIPGEINTLVTEREKAREAKDWAKSDQLREEISQQGYQVEDMEEGPRVRKI